MDLDTKRNQNREGLRALQKDLSLSGKSRFCHYSLGGVLFSFQGFQLVPNGDQKPYIRDTACGDEEENVAGLTLICLLFLRPQANYWSLLFLFPLPSPLFPQLAAGFMPRFLQSLPKCHIISEAIPLTLLYFSPEYLALSGSHKLYLCLFIPSPPLYHKPGG